MSKLQDAPYYASHLFLLGFDLSGVASALVALVRRRVTSFPETEFFLALGESFDPLGCPFWLAMATYLYDSSRVGQRSFWKGECFSRQWHERNYSVYESKRFPGVMAGLRHGCRLPGHRCTGWISGAGLRSRTNCCGDRASEHYASELHASHGSP